MQNPKEDTEWNDVLRAKGIIPQKEKEIDENEIISMMENTIKDKTGAKEMSEMTLDELDELEDEEEERILEQYRKQRMAEMKAIQSKSNFNLFTQKFLSIVWSKAKTLVSLLYLI